VRGPFEGVERRDSLRWPVAAAPCSRDMWPGVYWPNGYGLGYPEAPSKAAWALGGQPKGGGLCPQSVHKKVGW